MALFCGILVFTLCYASAKTNDIVKSFMENAKENVPMDMFQPGSKYKHLLQCSYEHEFTSTTTDENDEGDLIGTSETLQHFFYLRCFESQDATSKFAVLFFDDVPVDRLDVISCDKNEIEKSIFPPKLIHIMGIYYGDLYRHELAGVSPLFHYVKGGKCLQRLYRVEWNEAKDRIIFVERKTPTEERDFKICEEAKFSDCRALN